MSHYYENPEPDKLAAWVKDVAEAGAFEKTSARFPLMIFVSEVLKQNPSKAAQWCSDLSGISDQAKAYIGWSFFNANVAASQKCINTQLRLSESDVRKIVGSSRHDPLTRAPTTPADLDMLWSTFFATGNDRAVNMIIDVLGFPSPDKGAQGSLEMIMLKGSARWSLASNIKQHKRVAEIANTRRSNESGDLEKQIGEVIANASR